MDGKDKFGVRLLHAGEIECRVSAANGKGVSLLLYKDARVDQKILDETFGVFGWKRSHQCIDGSLYCTVEVKDKESGEWVAKQDVGAEGNFEKEKSQASDSFKRACFNWGIGRELYSAPLIWIPASKAKIQEKDGKYYCTERFHVVSIAYNDAREITGLGIADSKGGMVFSWLNDADTADSGQKAASLEQAAPVEGERKNTGAGIRKKEAPLSTGKAAQQEGKAGKMGTGVRKGELRLSANQMASLEGELKRTGVGMDAVRKRYRIEDPADMTRDIYARVMEALAKTKSAEAA